MVSLPRCLALLEKLPEPLNTGSLVLGLLDIYFKIIINL